MSIDINALKRAKQLLIEEMRALLTEVESRDDKTWTPDDQTKYDDLESRVKDLEGQIARGLRMNEHDINPEDSGEHIEDGDVAEDEFGFRSMGEMLIAVYEHDTGKRSDPRLIKSREAAIAQEESRVVSGAESRAATGQGTTDPTSAGFLVGTQRVEGLYERAYASAELASRCARIPVGEGVDGISMNAVDESSRADGSRWGGIRAYRRAEAETVTASLAKFRQMKLDLEDLMCMVYATERSLQDATQLEALINKFGAQEIAWVLDNEIINGTGAGQCLGWLNADSTVSIAKEAAQTADTIVYENVRKMRTRLWAPSRKDAVWFINQDCEDELATMAFVIGTSGVPVYLPATGISGKGYDTLFGRPVIPIEQAKTVGTKGDINFVDLSQYVLIDKGGIQNAVSMHVRFLYAENVFRFIFRVNGQPYWNLPLTPANGTNTLSPQITLDSRD